MKGILPKLLAKENITIQHGNYSTAWFDIKNRVLGLPMWKDMGKDVYDLLIGHEVGHALETPYEGWHDNPETLEGCPRTYINVIEDARIERKVKAKYPGLRRSFAKGYTKLFKEDFFGSPEELPSWDKIKLIDKINLEAKVGAHLDVPFTAEEQVYMDRAMTTDTFADVVELVKDVLAYSQKNEPELIEPPMPENDQAEDVPTEDNEEQDPTSQGHDDFMPEDQEQKEEEVEKNAPQTDGDVEDTTEEKTNSEPFASNGGDESITDKIFRSKEENLIEADSLKGNTRVGNPMSKEVLNKVFIPYAKVAKGRKPVSYMSDDDFYGVPFVESNYVDYIKDVKRSVNYAVKEFEQRKAAYRYTRSQTAKTGSLDINKLWAYKTNDDIFNRVTRLADAKNHGMFMLIDFSGSMSGVMHRVLDQLIHLVVFCKTVNIPFDVYGFTTCNPDLIGQRDLALTDSEIYHECLALPQQISSDLNKSDYTSALQWLYWRMLNEENYAGHSVSIIGSEYEDWGSTPLNTSLIAINDKLTRMIKSKGIDNMNLVVLTDGDTNRTDIVNNIPAGFESAKIKDDHSYWADTWKIKMPGKTIASTNGGKDMTKSLLNYYRKKGITTLGFFLALDRYQYNSKLWSVQDEIEPNESQEDFRRAMQKQITKKKCLTFDGALGYDNFYVVQAFNKSTFNTDADEFEVQEDATKGQITQAFKKYSKSKKLNKTLLTNFGKAVAV